MEDWKYGDIQGNRELRAVVDIIYGRLFEKIRYYGDEGPNMPDNTDKFVRRYANDIKTIIGMLNALKVEYLQSLQYDLAQKQERCLALETELNRVKAKQQKADDLLHSLKDMLENVKIDEIERLSQEREDLARQLGELKGRVVIQQNEVNEWKNKYKLLEESKQSEIDALSRRKDQEAKKIREDMEKTRENEEQEYMGIINSLKQTLGIGDTVDMKAKKEIKRELRNIRDALDKIMSEIESLKKEKEDVGEQHQQDSEKIKGLKTDLENLRKEIQSQKSQMQTLENAKNNAEKDLESKNKDIEELSEKNQQLEQKKNDFEKALDDQEQKIQNMNTEIASAKADAVRFEKDLKEWQQLAEAYTPVRDAMQECATFQPLLNERNLTGDSATTLFAFARAIGEQIEFAKAVHSCALVQKKSDPTPMTRKEQKVYDALNRCYRKACHLEFDIFVLPDKDQDRPVTGEFAKTAFDKNKMVNLSNEKDKSSRYATEIYVPLLKAVNGNMNSQSYVQVSQI